MLTRMRNRWRDWKRDHRVPKESFDEQTRSSWAIQIPTCEAVPNVYKDFFEPLLRDGRKFPYTVLTPSYERFIHRTTEKLICDLGNEIYILEKNGSTFEAQCYPIEGISYVEYKTILLDAYIKLSGRAKPGDPASSTLKFNSVTDYLLTPILERIRLATLAPRRAIQQSELEKFDHLAKSNYKFMNYAKRSLLGGEKVIHAILQPEIRVSVLAILGKTYDRTISHTHMTILTDRELIMIREEGRQRGNDRYGGIWDYIPLNKIEAISLTEKNNNLLALSIQLPQGACLESLFQASAKQELDRLMDQFEELNAAPPPGVR